jgi:branched-chain amino acid transport system substrate-binding protein
MSKRSTLKIVTAAALLSIAGFAQAQDSIKIANIVELSGPGTTAGTLFKNGVELAINEINAKGGILGKKITYTTEDTQTNPGVAKGLTQKAVDDGVFAIWACLFRFHHGVYG